jgi:hypothetical protein
VVLVDLEDEGGQVMEIHLPPDLEGSLIERVRIGMFPSLDAAITRAAHLLLETIEQAPSTEPGARTDATEMAQEALTIDELHRKLLAEGRISRLPDTAADYDDPDDQPIAVEGEPLSEAIIRERR